MGGGEGGGEREGEGGGTLPCYGSLSVRVVGAAACVEVPLQVVQKTPHGNHDCPLSLVADCVMGNRHIKKHQENEMF